MWLESVAEWSASTNLELSSLTTWLPDFLFEKWGGVIFESKRWRSAMDQFAIGLGLVAAGLLIIHLRAIRLGKAVPERTARRMGIFITVIAVLTYFDFFNPNTRYKDYYHRHELYHYYLGSKYFDEVGYHRLYECTAIAETELGFGAQLKKKELRDLRVNLIKPITDTYVFDHPEKCKDHFSDEKWKAFVKDIKWFEKSSRGDYWDRMKKDHGYNPPPVWTMAGQFISNLGVAGDGFFKKLALIDIFFHVGIVAMLGWAFRWRVMMTAAVYWGVNAVGSFYWTGGAFMRHDWLFLLVASLCLARKRWFFLSGAALIWAGLLRVFPLALFYGPAVVIAIYLWRGRTLHSSHKRFIAGAALMGSILLASSTAVTSVQAYKDFAHHISVHKNTPLTNHMGLPVMLSHDWDGRMVFTQDDRLDDPFSGWKDGRTERLAKMKPVFYAICLFVLAWIAWTLHRTRLLWISIPMGIPAIISLTNLTCYYYSIFLTLAVLTRVRPTIGPLLMAGGAASQVLLDRFYFIDDRYTAQSYLFFALGLLILYAMSRPFSLRAVKEWIASRPAPEGSSQPRPDATKASAPKAEEPEAQDPNEEVPLGAASKS